MDQPAMPGDALLSFENRHVLALVGGYGMRHRLPIRRNRRRDHLDYLPILLHGDLPHSSFGDFANLGPLRRQAIHGYRAFLTVIHAVYFMVRLISRLLHDVD